MVFQLHLASSGESGITNCLQGWEGGKQTLHRGREAPNPAQPRTYRDMDVSGEEKVKSQAGSSESWEAALFLPDTTEVTLSTSEPLSAHLLLQLTHGGPVVGSMGQSNARACIRSLGSFPSPRQAWEEKESHRWMQRGLQLLHLHPSGYAHLCTTRHYTLTCHPASLLHKPCSEGWLAATTHRKAASQLVCTGKETWRTEGGKGHI